MNICLISNGLTGLFLAKALINLGINVFIFSEKKILLSKVRTLAISQANLEFIQKKIFNLDKKKIWPIKKIEIFDSQYSKKKILDFYKTKNNLFSIVKNDDLYKGIENYLIKNKKVKRIFIKNKLFYSKIIKEDKYDLIINCNNNEISKKFFNQKIQKKYNSTAYATIINHETDTNKKAVQIFTNYGPIAFLPISKTQTSVIYSINKKKIKNIEFFSQKKLEKLIINRNIKYKIKSIAKFEKFNLNFALPRKYYKNNILAFGDGLHQIHPLAGQGFNMTLRDIKIISEVIEQKKKLGLEIDNSIFEEFENKTKHLNYLFASSIDLINDFFKVENKYFKNFSNKIFKKINKNKTIKNLFIKYANNGFDF